MEQNSHHKISPNISQIFGFFLFIGCILTIITFIFIWPMAPFFSYYMTCSTWILFVIFSCFIAVSSFGLFRGIQYVRKKLSKETLQNHSTGKFLFLMLIIVGDSVGIVSLYPSLYGAVELVPLSSFDQTGWEHFDSISWEANRDAYRDHLLHCWGDFPAQVPLNPVILSTEALKGYTRIKIKIDVENSGRIAWDQMSFYLLIPENPIATPCPAIVVFHQHDGAFSKGKEEPVGLMRDPRQAFALELVKQGYIAVAPDALCFSERQELSEYKTSKTLQNLNRTLNGKYVWDISRLLDYLETRTEIDSARIGIMGHSLGGQMAIYCGAYDSRIKLVISNCGIAKLSGPNSMLETLGEDNEATYLSGLNSGDHPMDMKEIVGLINKPIFISNGIKDSGLPILGVAELHNWCHELYNYYGNSTKIQTIRFNAGHGIYPNIKSEIWNFISSNI